MRDEMLNHACVREYIARNTAKCPGDYSRVLVVDKLRELTDL